MKRIVVLNVVFGVGLVSLVFAGQRGAGGGQQAPRIIEVEKLKDNVFLLKGGGGNTTVFVTSTGAVVVDAKNPGWGQPILDKIKELTSKPIARFPVDGSKLRESKVVLQLYRARDHFTRSIVVNGVRLGDWEAEASGI